MADFNKLINVEFKENSTKIPVVITTTANGLDLKILTPNTAIMVITKNGRSAFTQTDTMDKIVQAYKNSDFSVYNFKMLTAFGGQNREYLTFSASGSGANNISAAYIGMASQLNVTSGQLTGPVGVWNQFVVVEGDIS